MASTYSNLKIQLMTTGENLTTWGNVTNLNLGTALEEAIVGSADVTFSSGNVTLTLSDSNSSQTARNMRLNLTGTTGGATRTLTVPDIEKAYIVNNACADAVEVKNSTGSNVSVPAGKTMWVYSTGSNVVDVVTHLTSVTLGSPLPVASGGTGSNTATFSGANITSLNATNISSGTIANARTTASASNGASTIVARDASGNFASNVITANQGVITTVNATTVNATTLIGAGGGITALNASNISAGTVATARLASGTADNTTYLRGDQTWASVQGGQYEGTASPAAIMYNAQTIGENITIVGTHNAGSFGPITINSGYTVTVNSGGVWTIV